MKRDSSVKKRLYTLSPARLCAKQTHSEHSCRGKAETHRISRTLCPPARAASGARAVAAPVGTRAPGGLGQRLEVPLREGVGVAAKV